MKRRHYTPEFKCRVAKEAIEVGNYSVVARRYNLHQSMVGRWARQYKEEGELAFERANAVSSGNGHAHYTKELRELKRENERLKNLLGEKDLEIAILRDLLKKGPNVR